MCVPAPCPSAAPTGASQGEPSRDPHFGCRLSPSCRVKVSYGTISVPLKPLSRACFGLPAKCPHGICVGGAFPRGADAVWRGREGNGGGHSRSGAGSAADSRLPALAVLPTRLWAVSRPEERGSACPDLSACPWAKPFLRWFSKRSGPRQMEMVVVSPFPLPFSWQKPMVGVSCALLTAVQFLPLASLSGTEIQGGSDLPAAASCRCSYLMDEGAASPPGPARGSGAAGFGAVCESYAGPSALPLEGLYGGRDALAVPRGWICIGFIPRKVVARIRHPCPGSGSWQRMGQVNTARAASPSGRLGRENSVDGKLEAAVQVAVWFCCWVMQAGPCTCLCLSFPTCKALR